MYRRSFLRALPISIAALTARVRAQALRRPLKIGFVSAGGANSDFQGSRPTYPAASALIEGLQELGYRYGSDYVLEGRGGQGNPERYAVLARELVAANVDVIVAAGPTVSAVKHATTTIPVVMVGGATDPVEAKLVQSLATPGGNITGLTLQQADLVGKRLEILKEVVPGSAPIAVLWEETSDGSWKATQSAAAAQGWKLVPRSIPDRAAIEPACAWAKASGAASLLVISGGVMFASAPLVIDGASRYRLPAMYALRVFPEKGGLMSYAADLNDLYRRAAIFVDRIVKGSNPATMPIEQPTKFELVFNLRAAKALGLPISQTLLLRANEVIQ